MRILICTDGSPLAEAALNFAAPLAQAAGAAVTLLGVAPARRDTASLRAALTRAWTRFPAEVEEKVRAGKPAGEILAEEQSGHYDLLVFGSRGRRGLARLIYGSVASRLARYARTPLLIVKDEGRPIRRILACTGGDRPGEQVARWAGQVARWQKAEATILHVMSQLALSSDSKVDELNETAEQAIARATREGQHLARVLEIMREQGATRVQPKLRHGLVLEEIVAEANAGDYDLVAIGAHAAPELPAGWSWLRDYVFDDVADQIISAVRRPVLVVRGK
jgi:nucleotide-binding universal stress UspA family protein